MIDHYACNFTISTIQRRTATGTAFFLEAVILSDKLIDYVKYRLP